MPVNEASIPRLPGIPSPGVMALMRSGWLLHQATDKEIILGVSAAFASKEPSGLALGAGDLLPMSKGFLFVPRMTAFSLAREGDLYAIGKLAFAYTTEFILPIPDPVETAMKIGELVTELLEIDLQLPELADYELQKTVRHISTDPRTIAIPYVDIVDWRITEFMGKRRGFSLSTEDASGNQRDFFFACEVEFTNLDVLLAPRWKQEFQELVVQIVEGVIGGDTFWQEAREALRPGGDYVEQPERELHHGDLHIKSMPPRFYLGGTEMSAYHIANMVQYRLEDAGYKQAEAITGVYLYEDIGGMMLTLGPWPPYICWVRALTDQRLATELQQRMASNIDAWRWVLRDNDATHADFKYSYVEMLEKCARGESLGRVQVGMQGPYY